MFQKLLAGITAAALCCTMPELYWAASAEEQQPTVKTIQLDKSDLLSGTGGNSGTQASVAVIRGLALGEIEFADLWAVIWKEIRVSVLCGVCLAGANFAKMMLVDNLLLHNGVTALVAAVVCLTLVCVVFLAKLVGCSLPILAEKLGFDPAVMASPFITTIVDVLSLLIYFSIASALLGL